MVRRLVSNSPENTRYRLKLARLSVQEEHLESYLAQARYAIKSLDQGGRSRGTTRQLLDIVQIGGLGGVYAECSRQTDCKGTPEVTVLPASAWERPPYGSLQEVEAALLAER